MRDFSTENIPQNQSGIRNEQNINWFRGKRVFCEQRMKFSRIPGNSRIPVFRKNRGIWEALRRWNRLKKRKKIPISIPILNVYQKRFRFQLSISSKYTRNLDAKKLIKVKSVSIQAFCCFFMTIFDFYITSWLSIVFKFFLSIATFMVYIFV